MLSVVAIYHHIMTVGKKKKKEEASIRLVIGSSKINMMCHCECR